MPPLHDKIALVTGTSARNGIGQAIARRLAEDGAHVVVTDLGGTIEVDGVATPRLSLLETLAADLDPTGTALELDVTDAAQIDAVVAQVQRRLGRVDILVNNAGSLAGADNFMSTTPAQWTSSFNVNLLAPMMLSRAVIPGMQAAGGGRIINIGSTGSLGAEPGFGAYTAMKHGLVGLTKTIAAEFGPEGILCNIVCPGYIATDMHMAANTRIAGERGLSLDEVKAQRYASVALRDAGRPADVADAVAFLAGPQARYVTGITLPVSGGVPYGI